MQLDNTKVSNAKDFCKLEAGDFISFFDGAHEHQAIVISNPEFVQYAKLEKATTECFYVGVVNDTLKRYELHVYPSIRDYASMGVVPVFKSTVHGKIGMIAVLGRIKDALG